MAWDLCQISRWPPYPLPWVNLVALFLGPQGLILIKSQGQVQAPAQLCLKLAIVIRLILPRCVFNSDISLRCHIFCMYFLLNCFVFPLTFSYISLKPATSDYIVKDTGNCSPRYMRCTINQVTVKHYLFDGRMCSICCSLFLWAWYIFPLFCNRSHVLLIFYLHLECNWRWWSNRWRFLIHRKSLYK